MTEQIQTFEVVLALFCEQLYCHGFWSLLYIPRLKEFQIGIFFRANTFKELTVSCN